MLNRIVKNPMSQTRKTIKANIGADEPGMAITLLSFDLKAMRGRIGTPRRHLNQKTRIARRAVTRMED